MSSADSLATILERTRQNLLDLSLRNRLINTPRGVTRSKRLDIVDELSDEVFRQLALDAKPMGFLPGQHDEAADDNRTADRYDASTQLCQPEDDPNGGLSARHRDNQLQTRLTSPSLQERLLGLYYDARTFEEEQGVSILFLAIGFLEWYETDSSDKPRFAPLILVPVDLSRASVSSRFKLRFRDDDLETNLSLQAKLRQEFAIELPEVGDADKLVPSEYFAKVESAIAEQSKWKIHHNEIALWFFSFAKFLMYRDLDPATWPGHSPLNDNVSLRRLLIDGYETSPPICDERDPIDPVIPPQTMIHVTDADGSQAVVIEEVRRGRSLVVQGPPGTGKSQTITNLIATAVHAGKKVLFVAEKMAALEVVKNRLDRLGLGAICLELHSHKANKRSTLEELNRTLELRRPRVTAKPEDLQLLADARERLNRHAHLMNTPIEHADITPFQIIGHLVGCHADGVGSSQIPLNEPAKWTRTEFEERSRHLSDLENYLVELGDISRHPWRGVRRESPILPSDLQQLIREIRSQSTRLNELRQLTTELCTALQVSCPMDLSLKSIKRLTELGRQCSNRPSMDLTAIADPIWEIHPAKIQRLVGLGQRLAAYRIKLEDVVAEPAWTTKLTETRRSLASHGRCWCWFLYPDYWRAISTLRGILKGNVPPRLDGQLELIDAVMSSQAAQSEIRESSDSIGLHAFGSLWNDDASDFTALSTIVAWEQAGREALFDVSFRNVAARLSDTTRVRSTIESLDDQTKIVESAWQGIQQSLQLDLKAVFMSADLDSIPIEKFTSRFQEWESGAESLSKWIGYQVRRTVSQKDGLEALIAEFEGGSFDSREIVARFQQAYYESLLKSVFAKEPELSAFHGPSHEQQVLRFQELDLGRMDAARSEVALAHFSGIPHESGFGEMAVIRGEIAKKRMHRPIRQLLRDAGRGVQAIKPVFMMSPISVAQFLEPGVLEFDLLVMDEASQVTPEDALGAIARTKQIIVVGDSRQLPPSRFFSKMLDEGETEEEGDLINTSNLDSVLGLCVARGLPQRMLRWHYRSRHHSLIAVSNQEFYDNQLCVIPSPTSVSDGSGLHFRFVQNGHFDRGKTATNRREAIAIVDAVIDHARNRPTKSLGVASFSVAQRDAIRIELESRLRKHRELDEFFSTGNNESFFIKNLENVQGDERDFIFISVGYAPDPDGNMMMNFGPLGMDGGERRLNVLISRAKECCVVFSSITADRIDLGRARSRGAAALKQFLSFAETGHMEATTLIPETEDSEFERQVSIAVEQAGMTVRQHVGTNGFAIDMAVVDSEVDGRYQLAIECDGGTYHSSRWARDRDRLRQALLIDRGWQLHRVWSSDWLHRPGEELSKVLAAVDHARSVIESRNADSVEAVAAQEQQIEQIEREVPAETLASNSVPATPYIEANFQVPCETPLLEVDVNTLHDVVIQIVSIESPVHRSEVARRVLTLWQQQRLGPAIARAIDSAIELAIQSSAVEQDQAQFLTIPDQTAIPIRSRGDVKSAGLRKPEFIHPSEIQTAILQLATDHVGITRDQLCSVVAKMLGLKVVTLRLKNLIDKQLDQLIEQQRLIQRETKLYIPIP